MNDQESTSQKEERADQADQPVRGILTARKKV
jgi:hypothetical protein